MLCIVVKSWVTEAALFAVYANIQSDFEPYPYLDQHYYYISNIQTYTIAFIEPQICYIHLIMIIEIYIQTASFSVNQNCNWQILSQGYS